jgi:hypothetical protein
MRSKAYLPAKIVRKVKRLPVDGSVVNLQRDDGENIAFVTASRVVDGICEEVNGYTHILCMDGGAVLSVVDVKNGERVEVPIAEFLNGKEPAEHVESVAVLQSIIDELRVENAKLRSEIQALKPS